MRSERSSSVRPINAKGAYTCKRHAKGDYSARASLAMTDTTMLSMMMMSNSQQSVEHMLRGLLAMLVLHVLTNAAAYKRALRGGLRRWSHAGRRTVRITGKVTLMNNLYWWSDIPKEYTAIMHDVVTCLRSPVVLKEQRHRIEQLSIGVNKYMDIVAFDDADASVRVRHDITIKHVIARGSSTCKDSTYECHTYQLDVACTTGDASAIKNYIAACVERHSEVQLAQLKKQHVFVLSDVNKDTHVQQYKEVPFETTKSFDNLFFQGKVELMEKLQDFAANAARYQQLGMPHTFGMMFHGQPGCGKTSCIKAVARFTDRHVVVVPVHKIRNVQTLKDVFLNQTINGIAIPNSRRLYVFEDIDCGDWKHLVMSRKLRDADTLSGESKSIVTECVKLALAACKDGTDSVAKLTDASKPDAAPLPELGDLLELLDGIIEMPGRMLIMTSNHPEHIDEALLRPGRVDKVIEFKKMTRDDVRSMYRLWFDHAIPPRVFDRMKDYSFSQAEIGQLFAQPDFVADALCATS
jgi:hypothetical protein